MSRIVYVLLSLMLIIHPSPNQVTLCASEATPNREGKPSILSEEHHCQKARATRTSDLDKPQQAQSHLIGARVNTSSISSKPFVIGELYGQLGNQCFEVAATLSHAWDHGAVAYFPEFKTKTAFNIPINYEKVFWRLDASTPAMPSSFRYIHTDLQYVPIPFFPNMQLAGYFQSEKYFKKYKLLICALLAPSYEIREYLAQKYAYIIHHPRTVSIHLRTYYLDDPSHKEYPCAERAYFEKAVSFFDEDSLFVIFSDNIPLCKEHLRGIAKNMLFIEGEAYYHDFYLMSLCKDHIISNSSFSWWAAYLNPNKNKCVIAPKKWVEESTGLNSKDVIPEDWITIDMHSEDIIHE